MSEVAAAIIRSEDIERIIRQYPADKRHALAILQDIQRRYKYIPKSAFPAVGAYLGVSYADLYAMATFYRVLSVQPRGRHLLRVCDGTACHIKGGSALQAAIKEQLGLEPGQTTADGLFTLETVSCPGCCAMAPVLIVDDDYYPQVDERRLALIIAKLKGGAAND